VCSERHTASEVDAMLSRGTGEINKLHCGKAPLHWACLYGYTDKARILLRYGADRNMRDSAGRTPLDICVQPIERGWEDVAAPRKTIEQLLRPTPQPTPLRFHVANDPSSSDEEEVEVTRNVFTADSWLAVTTTTTTVSETGVLGVRANFFHSSISSRSRDSDDSPHAHATSRPHLHADATSRPQPHADATSRPHARNLGRSVPWGREEQQQQQNHTRALTSQQAQEPTSGRKFESKAVKRYGNKETKVLNLVGETLFIGDNGRAPDDYTTKISQLKFDEIPTSVLIKNVQPNIDEIIQKRPDHDHGHRKAKQAWIKALKSLKAELVKRENEASDVDVRRQQKYVQKMQQEKQKIDDNANGFQGTEDEDTALAKAKRDQEHIDEILADMKEQSDELAQEQQQQQQQQQLNLEETKLSKALRNMSLDPSQMQVTWGEGGNMNLETFPRPTASAASSSSYYPSPPRYHAPSYSSSSPSSHYPYHISPSSFFAPGMYPSGGYSYTPSHFPSSSAGGSGGGGGGGGVPGAPNSYRDFLQSTKGTYSGQGWQKQAVMDYNSKKK